MSVKDLLTVLSGHIWLRSANARRRLGSLPVAGRVLRSAAGRLLPTEATIWVRVRSGVGKGLALRVRPRFDGAYWSGRYEAEMQVVLGTRLQSGMVVCDVGAHIGFFSLIAAHLVGPSGAVVAIEADATNAERIEENAARNGFRHVEVHKVAAWSHSHGVRYREASRSSGRNTGAVVVSAVRPADFEVPSVTLDALFAGRRPPNLVKIDVEGAEAAVVAGAATLVARHRPILLVEVHDALAHARVLQQLRATHALYPLGGGGTNFPLRLVASPTDLTADPSPRGSP